MKEYLDNCRPLLLAKNKMAYNIDYFILNDQGKHLTTRGLEYILNGKANNNKDYITPNYN